jgi:hypothetical protein
MALLPRLSRARLFLAGIALLTAGLVVLPVAFRADAASPSGYEIISANWDGGGGRVTSQSGNYRIDGAAGQPDAGVLTGTNYKVYGGFFFPARVLADANCDLAENPVDPLFVLRYLAGLVADPAAGPCRGVDVNGDNARTLADAVYALQAIAGLLLD